MKQVKDIEELKTLAVEGAEFFIKLNGGMRSSKNITYDKDNDTWEVYNGIDDSLQTCTTAQLAEDTNIIKALDYGALWKY